MSKKLDSHSFERFIDGAEKMFGRRLISVVGYGSFFTNKVNSNDIDFVIVLDKYHSGDLGHVRQLYKYNDISIRLHCQILYRDEILTNGDCFSINTCGAFFLSILKNGTLLYGKNIFTEISDPSDRFRKISILQKVQQYVYQLKNLYINIDSWDDVDTDFLSKKLEVILFDAELFCNKKGDFEILVTHEDREFMDKLRSKSVPIPKKKSLLRSIAIMDDIRRQMADNLNEEQRDRHN